MDVLRPCVELYRSTSGPLIPRETVNSWGHWCSTLCVDFAEWQVTPIPMFLCPHPPSFVRPSASGSGHVSPCSLIFRIALPFFGVPFENNQGYCLAVLFSCFPRFSPAPHIYPRQSIISYPSYNVAYSITVSKVGNDSMHVIPTNPTHPSLSELYLECLYEMVYFPYFFSGS